MTNKTTSYSSEYNATAFQNGVELDSPWFIDKDNSSDRKDIKPGASITIQEAYTLDDESDVTIEIHEAWDWFDQPIVVKTFSVS